VNTFQHIIQKTHRVPIVERKSGPGGAYARQLDTALMSAGFKLSGELFQHFSLLDPTVTYRGGREILAAVTEMVGAHVQHNVYFRDFPHNVPDTEEFWRSCIIAALNSEQSRELVAVQLEEGAVNLLDLPKYGKYLHSYEEMVAAHEEFIPALTDRMTILHLGQSLAEEQHALYCQLAESPVPINEADRGLLEVLARVCVLQAPPTHIPVRENRAIINAVRFGLGQALLVDTVTDVLRFACHLSGGDVTLETPTKFIKITRPIRRILMRALDETARPAKLRDVLRYPEQWKRLGERLHPHEYKEYPHAQAVFAVARGEEKDIRSLAAEVESAFQQQKPEQALRLLSHTPGTALRALNRLLLAGLAPRTVTEVLGEKLDHVSSRVLLSLREYLMNRTDQHRRIFVNTQGKAFVEREARQPALPRAELREVCRWIDEEIIRRLPTYRHVFIDKESLLTALPLSQKYVGNGIGILPRGSATEPLTSEHLRFFVYWKEKTERTDYDLSVLFLDEQFKDAGQVSWTNLRKGTIAHSGDITSAKKGAFESIDIPLSQAKAIYIVPQVNIYTGEDFLTAEESFFGFMNLEQNQKGLPFEPRTVQMKSEMRGKGKVALPIIFMRHGSQWSAKWMHLYLNGRVDMNRVEGNKLTTNMLVRAIVTREYLTFAYVAQLFRQKEIGVASWSRQATTASDLQGCCFIGTVRPSDLPQEVPLVTPEMFMSQLGN
jgi:stress response protein SCP2